MKLIIGLGNIGDQYDSTRHNIGFQVIDRLAKDLGSGAAFSSHTKAPALIQSLKSTRDCILAKPTTMMNLSGQAVQALVQYYKVDLDDLWIIHDELDINFGQLRIRKGGSSAGNNGIKSIIQHLGAEFWRVRIGIANQHLPTTPSDQFVLDKFNSAEKRKIRQIVDKTTQILVDSLDQGRLVDDTQSLI